MLQLQLLLLYIISEVANSPHAKAGPRIGYSSIVTHLVNCTVGTGACGLY